MGIQDSNRPDQRKNQDQSSSPAQQQTVPKQKTLEEFNIAVDEIISSLLLINSEFCNVLQYDASTKSLRCRWAARLIYADTIGAINELVRRLKASKPVVEGNDFYCGFAIQRDTDTARVLAEPRKQKDG